MARQYINDVGGKFKLPLKGDDGKNTGAWLIWGDPVRVIETNGTQVKVRARGRVGWIPQGALTDQGLLELYVIDVGQGDGVLMRTPDDAWHLIDAGISNEKQMTRKGATNFVRWKFIEDLGEPAVSLKNVILTHPDFDHYGGMLDLFSGKVSRPDRTFEVKVENFFHSGMGRFDAAPKLGAMEPGIVPKPPFDDYGIREEGSFITELLDGKDSFGSPSRPFETPFDKLAQFLASVPRNVQRLSRDDGHVPGYTPGAGAVSIRVLGPVVETVSGKPGLRDLGSESETRNGHSVVLRVDYNKIRIMLTGDLNTASQRLLLSYESLLEFAVDVAKGCHHGSDDVDLRFVRAMKARVTVVSSGDNEDYAHPRPRILGASARYGREAKGVKGEVLPPLLYSTELARSVKLSHAAAVRRRGDSASEIAAAQAEVKTIVSRAKFEALENTPISTDLVYGLINVRTDGERVLCGYMKEGTQDFELQLFRGGVEP